VTRDAILTAARTLPARAGYGGATIRAIAGEAGVDPALVMHYFGTKESLFAATLQDTGGVLQRVAAAFDGTADELPRQLVTTYLALWEDPQTASTLASVVRSALTSPIAADAVRRIVEGLVIQQSGHPWPPERVNLVGAQLLGIAVARYVLRTEPLASLSHDALVELLTPQLDLLLNGPDAP
jgi:AcrR family transcriptional regulator